MAKLKLSVAVCDYDRTMAVLDGRAPIDGCDVIPTALEPEEAFHRAFKFQEFDVTEISLSSTILSTVRGDCPYIGVPAFVSRVFRHSGIYIRTDRGIKTPMDLKGKKIGLPEYQITANVWIRGILQDEYGLKPSDVLWRRGGIEEAGRGERSPIKLPADIDLQQIPDDKTLSEMLSTGELDGMISARAPSCYNRRDPHVGRLFPDFRKAEQDYFKKTGIFPPMHMIGIRKSLVEQHPWLPVNVYKAFLKAKEVAMYQVTSIGHLYATLPWSIADYEETVEVMGPDYWSYGLEKNYKDIDTLMRYSFEQGLSSRKLKPEDIFHPAALELSKI